MDGVSIVSIAARRVQVRREYLDTGEAGHTYVSSSECSERFRVVSVTFVLRCFTTRIWTAALWVSFVSHVSFVLALPVYGVF